MKRFLTMQVEFIRLSQVTGDPKYGAAAERVIQFLHDHFQEVPILSPSPAISTVPH